MNSAKPYIPKPCHEDWNAMSPEAKGRFCGMCAKTIIDFTAMDDGQVQSYLLKNRDKKVCGRFRQEQLDVVKVTIPTSVFYGQTQFRKMFILALLIVMGSTLLSCNGRQVMGEPAMDVAEDSVRHDEEDLVGELVYDPATAPPVENVGNDYEDHIVGKIANPDNSLMIPPPPPSIEPDLSNFHIDSVRIKKPVPKMGEVESQKN